MDNSRLSDVAAAAGVSVTTASRALSNRGELSVATRARVLEAAARLSYERDPSGRGRPTSVDPKAVEYVCGLFGDFWADETTAGARHAALSRGNDLVLTLERNRPEEDWPVRVSTRRSTGVVLGLITPTRAQLETMRGLSIPTILLEPPSDPPAALWTVTADVRKGGYDAAAHLLAAGYERFAILRGEPRLRFGRARDEGFRAGLLELAGITEVLTADGDWNGSTLQEKLPAGILAGSGRLGVFAYSDALGLAFSRLARAAGRHVPDEVGIVGVDGEVRGALADPPLTTVRQPLRAMAARAVELVQEQRDHPSGPAVHEVFPTELIARGTTSRVLPSR